jgi:transcriptional regulator with XRE-family HTH domain
MELKEYIADKLYSFRKEFKDFDPLYEYDPYSNTSFILVIPEYLNNNEEFELRCGKIIMEMIDMFPGEFICFITSDSLIELKNPTKLFDNKFSISDKTRKTTPVYSLGAGKRDLAIAERIRCILQERGMNESDLAVKMNNSQSEIKQWLTGHYKFQMDIIDRLEAIFGAPILEVVLPRITQNIKSIMLQVTNNAYNSNSKGIETTEEMPTNTITISSKGFTGWQKQGDC